MGEEMEANTCYLGIELNDSYAMVSYMPVSYTHLRAHET